MEENKDQKQFLMDLGKSAEEAVQRMRGFEENYYYFLQRSMQAVAWPRNFDFAEAAHRYANQDFGAALEFARELQNAEDFQDAARLQTKYAEACVNIFWNQAKDATQIYARFPTGAMTSSALIHSARQSPRSWRTRTAVWRKTDPMMRCAHYSMRSGVMGYVSFRAVKLITADMPRCDVPSCISRPLIGD